MLENFRSDITENKWGTVINCIKYFIRWFNVLIWSVKIVTNFYIIYEYFWRKYDEKERDNSSDESRK